MLHSKGFQFSVLFFGWFMLVAFYGDPVKAPSDKYKPIILNPTYEHTKWGISPVDLRYDFAAYTTSFDSNDDNNGDGKPDIWGIPEWVAFEIKGGTGKKGDPSRPRWMTDPALNKQGIAPNDATYAVSGTSKLKVVGVNSRYVRGHMCPKASAERVSLDAAYNTHTVLNAVPQLQWQNNGIWKKLEAECNTWSDKYDRIWVVCGPVFFGKDPAVWLGQKDDVKAAVPDALYKIVIREDPESETGLETLAFVFPNIIPKEEKDISAFLSSVEYIEGVTGLSFLTNASKREQDIARHEDIRSAIWSSDKPAKKAALREAQKIVKKW